MTLAELLPSVDVPERLDPTIWPSSAAWAPVGDVFVGGVSLSGIAARFGTPVQVLDEGEVRRRCRAFLAALPEAEIAYAGKALTCRAVLRWVLEEGLSLDVCSAGELAAARSVGFPAVRILLHGNAKTDEDLKAAFGDGVGRIVLDSVDEIDRVAALAPRRQDVLLRVTPGVDAHTHRAITTGVDGQKFGIPLDATESAVARVRARPELRLVGLHCHLGSQVGCVAAYEEAARRLLGVGISLAQLDLGGGFPVRYRPGDPELDLVGLATRIRVALHYECQARRLPVPRLIIEPGRGIVGPAGVTLYRVVSVKPGFVAVDGGMSDNPRPALYGARYLVRLIGRRSKARDRRRVAVVGRHCEAGDILAEDVPLPGDVHAGDLIAVPVTGAYHHSLASNYNLVPRPPIVAVGDGIARLIVRRETEEDLLRREMR